MGFNLIATKRFGSFTVHYYMPLRPKDLESQTLCTKHRAVCQASLSEGKVDEMIKKSWVASLTFCVIILTSSFFVPLGTAIAFPSNGAISGNTYTNPSTGTISFSGYVWNVENSGSSTWVLVRITGQAAATTFGSTAAGGYMYKSPKPTAFGTA